MTDIDPQRLVIAAHELGHAIVWRASGFTIREIWIKGRGDSAHGWCGLTDANAHHTPQGELGYQAGLLGAAEAQHRWCSETGVPFDENACREDYTNLRTRAKDQLGRQIKRSAATAEARRIIRANWRRIVLLTPKLAAHGSLSPSRV